MSGDEILALVIGLLGALCGLWQCIVPLLMLRLMRKQWMRWAMLLAILLPMIPLWLVLTHWAARDVRENVAYIALFLLWGAGVECLLLNGSGLLGIHWRDHALEGRNPAALAAISGAILGAMLVYTGSNIGEGPTIWTTLGPAAVGLVIWALLWLALQLCADAAEAIVVERDLASGLRLAGLLAANGLVLGRSLAGDWVSPDATLRDCAIRAWPVLPFTVLAIAMQRLFGPIAGTRRDPLSTGLLPATILLSAAVLWLAWQGGIR